jgi:branched-chain amino acid transport system substrate-binding protein
MISRQAFSASLGAAITLGPAAAKAQAAKGNPYKIGITYPLTGPLAVNTPAVLAGAQIAVAKINSEGGVKGRPLALAVEDTQGTPQGGVTAMRKLVQVDGVQAIITIFTNIVTAQMPLGDQLKVPSISTIETPGLVGKSQFSFAHSQTMAIEGPFLQEFWKMRGYKRVFAFYGDNGFGHLIEPMVKPLAAAAGAQYDEAFLDMGSSDFRGVIARAKGYNPDAIFITAQGSAAEIATIKQIRELGLNAPMFNGSNFYYDPEWRIECGPYSEKMYFVGLNVDKVAGGSFIRAYKAKLGVAPGYQPGLLYDMVHMYAWAIGRGGYTGEAIRDGFLALNGSQVKSVMGGGIVMGADHYTQSKGIALWQVQHGNEVRILPKLA